MSVDIAWGVPINFCRFITLVALMLEEGLLLFWSFGFVETSTLVLYNVPKIWLKILGMFIWPMLWLSAGLFFLTCMASLASLETCLLSWSVIVNWDIWALGCLWIILCQNIALVDGVLCSLTLLFRHLLDSPI